MGDLRPLSTNIIVKNNKYFPMELFRMESGLAIYESQFKSVDGSRGVVAGPHKSFNGITGSVNHVYLTEPAMVYCQMHSSGQVTGLPDIKVVDPDKELSDAPVSILCDPSKKSVDHHGHTIKFHMGQVKTLSTKANDKEQITLSEHLCGEEISVSIAGMKCSPKSDQSPSINDMNFGESLRGQNPENGVGIISRKVSDASENSSWVKGPPWASRHNSEFSVKTSKLLWTICLIIFMSLFCVPAIVKISPLSYGHALVDETHWYDPNVNISGVETRWRHAFFTDTILHNKLSKHSVDFQPYPVSAYYIHGKVERQIEDVPITFSKSSHKTKYSLINRLSIIQRETSGCQVANALNNMPIAMGNVARHLEHQYLITPNQPMLGRRNNDGRPSERMNIYITEHTTYNLHHFIYSRHQRSSSFTLPGN